jgi:hypothetical protein
MLAPAAGRGMLGAGLDAACNAGRPARRRRSGGRPCGEGVPMDTAAPTGKTVLVVEDSDMEREGLPWC